MVNFAVTLTLKMVNFTVFVSKNRNLPSKHFGGEWSLLSEHLAGSRHPKNEHFT
jgi:hypothetical protein